MIPQLLLAALIALLWQIAVGTIAAHAAPPAGADLDGPRHVWFERQHSVSGAWCCNLSDGHLLDDNEWRQSGVRYQVRIGGSWRDIPSDAMRDPAGGPNDTGKAIVWYTASEGGLRIYCFCPGTMY